MTDAGAAVDVVRARDHARELLGQIVFFVGLPRRRQHTQGVRPAALDHAAFASSCNVPRRAASSSCERVSILTPSVTAVAHAGTGRFDTHQAETADAGRCEPFVVTQRGEVNPGRPQGVGQRRRIGKRDGFAVEHDVRHVESREQPECHGAKGPFEAVTAGLWGFPGCCAEYSAAMLCRRGVAGPDGPRPMAQRLRHCYRWFMKSIDVRPLVAIAALLAAAAAFAGSQTTLLWVDEHGRPIAEAAQALTYLRNVRDEGLDPADFESPEPEPTLQFDSLLTQNMLRYLQQLHMGRVDPRALGFDLPRARESHDFDAMLRAGVTEHRLEEIVESLVPRVGQYRGLREALKAYRAGDPSSPRIRQIELALERLRWLPELDGRVIAVNIPMFRLWAWDPSRPDATIDMAVVVGRAQELQTPVFTGELTDVVFRPYWNVPTSIIRNEILPALRRDPNYLARHNMEIVGGSGADMRVRQRPGPGNALGLVKFVFPNKYDVYMHATPSTARFHQERRDFSHGCVRVEDPVTLAEWALQPQAEWTRERIVEAMNGADTMTIPLFDPVTVVMFYQTAAVNPVDGTVRFADDIYRHDARLDAALKARSGGGE